MLAQTQEPMTLRWYLDVLRERWRVVYASTVVGALLAVLFLALTTEQVTARTVVRLDVIDATPFDRNDAASRLIDSQTEVALASSFEVSSRAAALMADGTTSREIRDSTSVSSVIDATVINVSYTAETEAAALKGADAVADAYLQYRSDEAQARIDAYANSVEGELETARLELASLTEQLASFEPDSPLALQAEVDRTIALQSLSALTNQRYELGSIDATGGSVISPASENPLEYSPSTRLVIVAGVFGGLLVGAALAFVRNATAKRVSNARQLGVQLGATALGSVEISQALVQPGVFQSRESRAVSARLLTEFPIGLNTLLAVDATEANDISLGPFIVAASMVELGEVVDVVVVGATGADRAQLAAALDLHGVDEASSPLRYRSSLVAGLHVLFVEAHEGRAAFAATIDHSTTAPDGEGPRAGFTMIVVPNGADEETQFVALGAAEAVVVFVEFGRTRRSRLQTVAVTSARVGVQVLGAVAVKGRAPDFVRKLTKRDSGRASFESPNGPPAGSGSTPAVGRL